MRNFLPWNPTKEFGSNPFDNIITLPYDKNKVMSLEEFIKWSVKNGIKSEKQYSREKRNFKNDIDYNRLPPNQLTSKFYNVKELFRPSNIGREYYDYEDWQKIMINNNIDDFVKYREYKKKNFRDKKLPMPDYYKIDDIFSQFKFYNYEEFKKCKSNIFPDISGAYYMKNYTSYNDSKLPSDPCNFYKKPISEIFGNIASQNEIRYTLDEFRNWLILHPEMNTWTSYRYLENKTVSYKNYNDSKLPADPAGLYGIIVSELFSDSQKHIPSEEKKKIFEQRIQISGSDYFLLTVLYGFEMSFDEEKAKSYYKSIGGTEKNIKCFNPNFVPKSDGHRFDGFELSEFPQITSSDINSILRFDYQRFLNLNKESLQEDDFSCIDKLSNDNTAGEYFIKFKKLVLSKWDAVQNFKTPADFKSKKNLTLFQKLTIIDFME